MFIENEWIGLFMDNQKLQSCATHDHHHEGNLFNELLHHLPYAVFSLALGLIILSVLDAFGLQGHEHDHSHGHHHGMEGANLLFHSFHFLHILFAVTGRCNFFAIF